VTPAADLATLFDPAVAPVRRHPFPHAVIDDFLRPEVFEELKATFPEVPAGRAPKSWARSLYWGDEAYERHLDAHLTWRALFNAVHSQAFVEHIRRQFAEAFESPSFLPDPDKLRFVSYCEDRQEKETGGSQPAEHAPEDIWARLDIYHGWPGYTRAAHLDHRRRLLSMLLYFDSAEEIGMVGGRLTLHRPETDLAVAAKLGAYRCPPAWLALRDRWSKPVVVEPMRNRAAMFPCTPRSWHSVPVIEKLDRPRAFVHIVLSSSYEVWR